MAIYLYEFLYRGNSDGTGDYHVILANTITDAFGNSQTQYSQPMTPTQATAAGYSMPTILAGFNAGLQTQNTNLTAQVNGSPVAPGAPVPSLITQTAQIAGASYTAKLQRNAAALAAKGQTWQAVQLLLQAQGLNS